MSFKSNGNLEKLRINLSELPGTSEVKLVDLMNSNFISSCSRYSSLEELFDSSGFKIESKEDFSAIPDDDWNTFIQANTTYENWLEMQKAAMVSYAKAKLLKGLK